MSVWILKQNRTPIFWDVIVLADCKPIIENNKEVIKGKRPDCKVF